ncbi:translesion DNA synthesis-associated protein ImuA [Roseateles sp. DC23W]|uniref:Translesion DNA synthesis-associated protein ImuA n=1 Tax=Pelomonas dachongensis TaxID=3299029 RepID=A0ABW7EUQ1_9BURK
MSAHPVQEDLLSSLQSPSVACEKHDAALEPVALPAPAQNAAGPACHLPDALIDSVWRADQLGHARTTAVSTGFAALDAEIPEGGWPCGCLIEILQPQPSVQEWRLIGPSLRPLLTGGRAVVVVGPPKPPHLPGLRHLGIDEQQLKWVAAAAPSQRLWATEQLLRANAAAAVVAWMPQARPEQLRRLQVLAQACEGLVFICRPLVARHDPSPAPLRIVSRPLVDWQIEVQIVKRRGPAQEVPLQLSSVPGGIEHVLTPRTRRPSALTPTKENHVVVGRSAYLDPSDLTREVLERVASL